MENKLSYNIPDYKKIRVIVDTDAACEADDPFAIAHALMCRKFIVKGITAEHFVEKGSVQKSKDEVDTILRCMDSDVPSFLGESKPFCKYDEVVSAEGLSPATKFIAEEAGREDSHPLYVLCIGAITNVAYAIKSNPEIAKKMNVIWIGGHNYEHPFPWREFNSNNDIDAASYVILSGVQFWQVPSDVYGSMNIGLAELEEKVKPCGKIGEHLFSQMIEYNLTERANWTQGESWSLGDSPAVGIAMNPMCGKFTERHARLFNADGSYGADSDTTPVIRVYESVDSRFVLEDFFAKLRINFGYC